MSATAGGKRGRFFKLTFRELRELLERVEKHVLETDDWPLIRAWVVKQITWSEAQHERMVAKAAAAVADSTAASGAADSNATSESSNETSASGNAPSEPPADGPTPAAPSQSDEPKPNGHGRNGAGAYRAATPQFHPLAPGALGARCERCKVGRLGRYREKVIIRIVGQPLFGAEAHHYEQVRCRQCGRVVRAEGPSCVHEGIGTDYVRYDPSACAMLLVMHYSAGAPFKRLESLHSGWGVPMPDANQWALVNQSDDRLLPVYKALEQHAIGRATSFRIDDTGTMVLTLKRQIGQELEALRRLGESTKDVRTGINATGIYWETPEGPVVLFYTGRHHAGEIVDRLLPRRSEGSAKLVKCTDGASKNFAHAHADALTEASCNAHALLKFRDIKDKYPVEYAEAGRVYKQVFDHDDEAKALGLTGAERMAYHRTHSKPLMLELKKMCVEKLTSRQVEPNSPLWEPLTFVVNQWDRLTQFYEAPGVPLDTNLVEQALIMPVRYLAGSFNYHTEDGAAVGDHAMSLIATARAHGVEPVAYLTECLRRHEDVAERPEHYLPWAYRERNKEAASSRAPPQSSSAARATSAPPSIASS